MNFILKKCLLFCTLFPLLSLAATMPDDFGGEERYYHIVWHNNAASYMTETGSGLLQVEGQSRLARQYWQFIPSGRANCYFIKNAVTGHYIEKCKTTQDNTYNISAKTEPIEYYVAQESTMKGACRLTSTNCSNYDDTSKKPVGLNKNGANSYIITWAAATSNTGSYWDINATEFDYDYEAVDALKQHTAFARSAQIYFMPCGSINSKYSIKSLTLTGNGALKTLDYPCATWSGSAQTSATPNTSSWWTLYTTDKAILAAGRDISVEVRLAASLPTGYTAQLCFDWNRDGVFDDVKTLQEPRSRVLSFEASVPADAALGESRMRFRLTDNGLDDPDDEVTAGQILDCIVEVAPQFDLLSENDLVLGVNDPARGTTTATFSPADASVAQATAQALPSGDARFLCWLEGRKVVSTEARYTFDFDRPRRLTAVFTHNSLEGTIDAVSRPTTHNPALSDAAAHYYNLSGQRVANPERGSTYIRKTTDKAATVVVFQ